MLFKTQSASVYGIDAYLVDVEVDGTPSPALASPLVPTIAF
jgi:hypothetical protein